MHTHKKTFKAEAKLSDSVCHSSPCALWRAEFTQIPRMHLHMTTCLAYLFLFCPSVCRTQRHSCRRLPSPLTAHLSRCPLPIGPLQRLMLYTFAPRGPGQTHGSKKRERKRSPEGPGGVGVGRGQWRGTDSSLQPLLHRSHRTLYSRDCPSLSKLFNPYGDVQLDSMFSLLSLSACGLEDTPTSLNFFAFSLPQSFQK